MYSCKSQSHVKDLPQKGKSTVGAYCEWLSAHLCLTGPWAWRGGEPITPGLHGGVTSRSPCPPQVFQSTHLSTNPRGRMNSCVSYTLSAQAGIQTQACGFIAQHAHCCTTEMSFFFFFFFYIKGSSSRAKKKKRNHNGRKIKPANHCPNKRVRRVA